MNPPEATVGAADLERAAANVIRESLAVREGERLLVICNPATRELGDRLRDEGEAAGADSVLAVMAEVGGHGREPPAPVAAAMLEADVILVPTVQSMSHTEARRAATERGARIATLPGATEEMLARTMSADMAELRRRCEAIAAALTGASEALITCPNGSELRLGLAGRDGAADSGDLSAPGAFGNLPCGEGYIAPVEGSAEGTLVVDGTIAGMGIPAEPARLTIEEGHLTAAEGADGERLLAALREHGANGTNVAELGVGANERAVLGEELLEAEKILGTVHVAFGASAAIGGTVQVPIHIDCVVTKPDLLLDGEPIVRAGELLV
jgi:leucyl aminopeptidase (aminopeptidase T)